MAKHIGIVAVSAEGALLCYRTICSEGSKLMGPHLHPEISMHNFPLAEHLRPIENNDYTALAELMNISGEKLAKIGADFLICPDNTNHLGYDEVVKMSSLPWLHIAEEVARVASESGYGKIGVLGTKFLMESDIYQDKFKARKIAHEIPPATVREEINRIIFDELVYGDFKSDARDYLLGAISEFKNIGCDAVVLGCTEIPLIVFPENSELPTLDSTRILACAALREALSTGE